MEKATNEKKFNLKQASLKTINSNNLVSKSKTEQPVKKDRFENPNPTWSKISKTRRLKQIKQFSQSYTESEEFDALSDQEKDKIKRSCWIFLRDAIDKKRINNKDVVYNPEFEAIIEIKSLVYNRQIDRFALKRGDNGSFVAEKPTLKLNKFLNK